MKTFVLLSLFCILTFTLTGCPNLQKFAETVDTANATWLDASDELKAIGEEVIEAQKAFAAAIESKDMDAIAKAGIILQDTQARYEAQKGNVEVAREAVEKSIQQYKDAQKEQNYWWTVPGMLLGGILGGLGIRVKTAPIASALAKTAGNLENILPGDWMEKVKEAQSNSMTASEKKALSRVRG